MADVQIKVKGDFSEVMNQIKSLSGIGTKLTATFSDISAASRLAFGAIDAGSKTANKTIQTLLSRMQSLANSKSPLSDAQLSKELLTVERRYGAGTKATAEFSKLILEAQSTAIRRALENTTTGINKSLDSLIKSLSSYKLEYTDAEGKQQFQRIGVEAREAIKTLHASIAEVAKKGLEYIDADAINKWGLAEFGSNWTKTGVTGLSLSGSGSAQSELSRVLTKANNEIYKNIKNSIESIVADATASGKKVSDDVIQDLQSRLSALKKGASFDGLTGDALKRRLDSIDKFSKDIIDKVRRYNDSLVEQAGIDKLESRIKSLSDTLTRKGKWSSSSGDLQTLFKTSTSDIGVKLTRQFDELRNVVTNTFKREIADFEKLARETGKFDSTTFTSALKSGVDWNVVVEARRRVFAAIQQHNQKQAAEVAKSLADDAREIEDALREAGRQATTGLAPSSKLETLINNYKGKDAAFYVDVLHETRLRALEERIKQSLAVTGKLAAGLQQSFELEAARANIRLDEGDLPLLFQELANRKQLEVQTAIDKFNEQYAAALLRLKEEFVQKGYKQEKYDVFEKEWARKAANVGLTFSQQPLADLQKAVVDAAAERNRIALARIDEQLVKDQQRLVDKVKNAIASAWYKGTSVSVSTATPLFAELQSAITSATNNTGSLVVAVSQLRQNVFKGLSAEIKHLEKDALAVGSAIKQSDIADIQSKITAAAPNLLTHEVGRLNASLSNAVKTVDAAVRQAGIDAVRNALTAAANNLQLSSKEIIEQVRTASAELRNLGVSRNERVSIGDVLNVEKNQNLGRILQREAQLANNALQKQAMDVLRGLNASAEMSAKVIAYARRQFVAAGGSANTFEAVGEQAVTSHVLEVVRELKETGKELDRGRINYFNNLYQAITTDQLVLEHARRFLYEQAASVNANAQTMRVDALQTKIREVYTQANQLGQVVSKTIEEGLMRQWESFRASLPQGTVGEFRSVFNAELLKQKELRLQNSLRQRAEGIIKPYEQLLDELSTLGSVKGNTVSSSAAQLLYRKQVGQASFIERVIKDHERALAQIELEVSGKVTTRVDADARIAEITRLRNKIVQDGQQAVISDLQKTLDNIRKQIKPLSTGNDVAGLSALGKELDSVRTQIAQAGLSGSSIDRSAQRLVGKVAAVEQDIAKRIENNAALDKARALLRSQTMKLGGANAMQMQIDAMWTETRSAMAVAFKNADRALAKKLHDTGKQLEAQIREQFAMRSAGKGSGSQNMIGGVPEGIYRNYLRQLPMQITDIVVGLSTGQRPMYVLLQQGGQLKDMFGGIGNAVKEVGKYILGLLTPMNLLAAGITATVGGALMLAKRVGDIRSEIQQTDVILRGVGRSFDFTTIKQYGVELSRAYGIMESGARKAVLEVAKNARVPEQVLAPMVKHVRDLSALLGNGFDKNGMETTFRQLSEAFSIPIHGEKLQALGTLLTQVGWLDDETREYVTTLYKEANATKDVTEKGNKMQQILQIIGEKAQGAADEGLTDFEKQTLAAKNELIKAWTVLADDSAWVTLYNTLQEAGTAFVKFGTGALQVIKNVFGALRAGAAGIANTPFGGHVGGLATSAAGAVGAIGGITPWGLLGSKLQTGEWLSWAKTGGSVFVDGFKMAADISARSAGKDWGELYSEGVQAEIDRQFSAYEIPEIDVGKPKGGKGYRPPTPSELGLGGDGNKKRGGSRGKSESDKDLENARRYVQQLKEQYDQVSKMSVSQKLEYDLTEGKVKLHGELLDRAREYARVIDERALQEAEATRQMQLQVLQEEKRIALENRYREMQYEVAKLMGSDRSADYFKGLIDFDIELERNAKKIRRERDKAIREAEVALKPQAYIDGLKKYYDDWLDEERKFTADSIELYKQRQKELDELSRQWTVGYKDGLEEVADWLFSISSEVSSAVQNWAGGLADALATAARTGKLSFKDLANSILDDIARIASRQFVSALFGGFQYGWTATPQSSQSKTAESLMSKSVPQNVFVVNKGFGSFTKAAESLGGITEAVKGGFTLGGGSNIDLGSDPWGLSTIPDKTVQRIGAEVSPVIKEGANSMFSGLFDKIGSIFSGIGSSISHLFSSIKLPSFSGIGGGGGFFSSLFSGIGGFFSSLFGLSSGGYTGPGGKYTPAGIVHKGEFVINAASTRKLGLDFLNRLNGYADGGYVTPTPSIVHSNMSKDMNNGLEVNIYNQTDSKITAQRNSSGGLDIFVEQAVNAVAGNIAAGGAVASAIQRAYALNRGVGTQRTGY